ncbi:MAG TPA: flagellar export chaperone FliS [Bryobacteraceae bacterium]|nr:flagellar export chaperone FliS [Bryobacteraceae bacterium]
MPLSEVHGEYLESQVLTADPLELVRLLYRAAIEATRDAQVHLRAGRIGERASRVSKAHAILTQLSLSLDHSRGGTLSRSLAELYDYLQRRLIEANTRQRVEPLVEVEGLLLTLAEGWDKLRNADDALPGARPAGAGGFAEFGAYPAAVPGAPETAYASQSWSF